LKYGEILEIRELRQKNCRFVALRQDKFIEWTTPANSKGGRKYAAHLRKSSVSVAHQQAEL